MTCFSGHSSSLYNRAINDFFFSHTSDGMEVFITHSRARGREILPETRCGRRWEGGGENRQRSERGRGGGEEGMGKIDSGSARFQSVYKGRRNTVQSSCEPMAVVCCTCG